MANVLFVLCLCVGFTWGNAPDLFEGDIVLTDATRAVMKGQATGYDGISNRNQHWVNGIIPYVFDRNFDSSRRKVALQAMSSYHTNTCIRFKPRTVERNYIRLMIGGGCYSNIGRRGGSQDVSIGNGCNTVGTVIHELMHAVGFYHEQSRIDRDNYINIYWNNIPSNVQYNFQKYSHGEADYFGGGYDLDSVMHYRRTAFGIGGRVTIAAKNNYNRNLGSDYGFSKTDIQQINTMYRCNGATSAPVTSKPTGSCIDNDSRCSKWASIGECNKNPNYMSKNCKKSCNLCPGCADKDGRCPKWASNGECRKNPNYMLNNCKKSCNSC